MCWFKRKQLMVSQWFSTLLAVRMMPLPSFFIEHPLYIRYYWLTSHVRGFRNSIIVSVKLFEVVRSPPPPPRSSVRFSSGNFTFSVQFSIWFYRFLSVWRAVSSYVPGRTTVREFFYLMSNKLVVLQVPWTRVQLCWGLFLNFDVPRLNRPSTDDNDSTIFVCYLSIRNVGTGSRAALSDIPLAGTAFGRRTEAHQQFVRCDVDALGDPLLQPVPLESSFSIR